MSALSSKLAPRTTYHTPLPPNPSSNQSMFDYSYPPFHSNPLPFPTAQSPPEPAITNNPITVLNTLVIPSASTLEQVLHDWEYADPSCLLNKPLKDYLKSEIAANQQLKYHQQMMVAKEMIR